ncbi:hypothetical protein BSKO_00654 [Bryopsis sp. KO-2023]|nr:hypothetical protein BSKO_00654 [Bryopsis sp. KO-2023]
MIAPTSQFWNKTAARRSTSGATPRRCLVTCSTKPPLVKVCGVTNADDAAYAAKNGANFIGMIMWPKAKRYVPPTIAHDIANAARDNGASPIGVFVDESAEKIWDVCQASSVAIAQLHGNESRSEMDALNANLETIYVLNAHPDGRIETALPDGDQIPDWFLIDSLKGGSGKSFDWANLTVPEACSKGWFLAGGLTHENVSDAVRIANPTCVDVSSGVCGPDGLKKDWGKVKKFIENAKSL